MCRFLIVKKDDVDHWKDIAKMYNSQTDDFFRFKAKVQREQDLLITLQEKMSGTGAVVYCINKDKKQNNTYVCVQDHRKPHYDADTNTYFYNGELNIFVLSTEVYPTKVKTAYTDMPFLQATFNDKRVTIHELHCDHRGHGYEGKGYATMMVDALCQIARESNCLSIIGMLSEQDAKTDDQKVRRNGFYKQRGFTLSFHDKTQKEGSIYLEIEKQSV